MNPDESRCESRWVEFDDPKWVYIDDFRLLMTGAPCLWSIEVLVAVQQIARPKARYQIPKYAKTSMGPILAVVNTQRRRMGDQNIHVLPIPQTIHCQKWNESQRFEEHLLLRILVRRSWLIPHRPLQTRHADPFDSH